MHHYTATSLRAFAGHQPSIGARVLIDPSALVLGDVSLGDDVSIWPMAVVRGDMHWIHVGARTSVQDGSVLHITHAGPYNADGWPLTLAPRSPSGTTPRCTDAASATACWSAWAPR